MNKKYLAPSIMVIRVNKVTLLSGSIKGTNVGLEKGGGTKEENIIEGNARRSSFWDDED